MTSENITASETKTIFISSRETLPTGLNGPDYQVVIKPGTIFLIGDDRWSIQITNGEAADMYTFTAILKYKNYDLGMDSRQVNLGKPSWYREY